MGGFTVSVLPPPIDRFEQCTQVRQVFDLLGRGCVAFYPRLADLTGSVTAALLLGQCLYWTRTVTRQQPQRDGWFWKTAAEWQRETGLSRREQDSARRILRALGLLEEQRRGMPARRWFRLDLAGLRQQLDQAPGAPCGGWPWDDSDLGRSLGQPVVYWRRLHDLTGSVTAALYLSRALFWQRLALQQPQPHGPWFHRPIFHSQQVLRLGRRQQEHARANLRSLGLIEERVVAGLPPRLLTRLELKALAKRLASSGADCAVATRPVQGSWQAECRNPADRSAALRQATVHESAKQGGTDAPTRYERLRQPCLAQWCIPHIQGITAEKHQPETLRPNVVAEATAVRTVRGAEAGVGVLQFPKFILPDEQPVLAQIVGQCPEHAQTILDELAGQAQNPARKVSIGNPLAYARALTQRALAGGFIPEAAMQIAVSRQRQNAEELRQQREREERHQREAAAIDPRERAAADAKRVECLARIRTLLAPARSRPGLRA
jgi:hypothetical protein